MGLFGKLTERFPVLHSSEHVAQCVASGGRADGARLPGGWDGSALCPLSLLRTTAVAPCTPGHWASACFFSSSCCFPNSFSLFLQGVSVCPAGRAGLPVRTPQGHPQEFQAGETPPQALPTQATLAGVQRWTLPFLTPLPAPWVQLCLGIQRPKEWIWFIWG